MTDDAIPAGMVPWLGGDAAPADWDGGPVLLRNCSTMFPSKVSLAYHSNGTNRWNHRRENKNPDWDIIAYTPAASSDERDGARGDAREALRRWHRDSCYPDAMPFELDIGLKAILAASRPTEAGAGWVAWNPDSGEEYTPDHPVESGECVDAERIRRSTPQEDVLWQAFQEQFMRAEALSAALATPKPPVDEAIREALLAAKKALLPLIQASVMDGPNGRHTVARNAMRLIDTAIRNLTGDGADA